MSVNSTDGMPEEMESWLQVVGYEGLYLVSSLGRIKSLHPQKGRILKPNQERYLRVGLTKDFYLQTHSVHRLVAIAFIPNPNELPQVNHKDANKHNNKVNNLEWCDSCHNMQHAEALGLVTRLCGEDSKTAKLTQRQVDELREALSVCAYGEQRILAHRYGISEAQLSRIKKGTRWSTHR